MRPAKKCKQRKIKHVSEMLAAVCNLEQKKFLCPADWAGRLCPFPEKLCEDVTPEDWKAWMEADE